MRWDQGLSDQDGTILSGIWKQETRNKPGSQPPGPGSARRLQIYFHLFIRFIGTKTGVFQKSIHWGLYFDF